MSLVLSAASASAGDSSVWGAVWSSARIMAMTRRQGFHAPTRRPPGFPGGRAQREEVVVVSAGARAGGVVHRDRVPGDLRWPLGAAGSWGRIGADHAPAALAGSHRDVKTPAAFPAAQEWSGPASPPIPAPCEHPCSRARRSALDLPRS